MKQKQHSRAELEATLNMYNISLDDMICDLVEHSQEEDGESVHSLKLDWIGDTLYVEVVTESGDTKTMELPMQKFLNFAVQDSGVH
jgi:hypothetical protein